MEGTRKESDGNGKENDRQTSVKVKWNERENNDREMRKCG